MKTPKLLTSLLILGALLLIIGLAAGKAMNAKKEVGMKMTENKYLIN